MEFFSLVGLVTVVGYAYVGYRVGASSHKAGNTVSKAAWDAFVWPHTIISAALDKLVS
jgi:hypothetical protein